MTKYLNNACKWLLRRLRVFILIYNFLILKLGFFSRVYMVLKGQQFSLSVLIKVPLKNTHTHT